MVSNPTSLREAATDEALGLLPVLRRLRRRFDRLTTSLEHGSLTACIRVRLAGYLAVLGLASSSGTARLAAGQFHDGVGRRGSPPVPPG